MSGERSAHFGVRSGVAGVDGSNRSRILTITCVLFVHDALRIARLLSAFFLHVA